MIMCIKFRYIKKFLDFSSYSTAFIRLWIIIIETVFRKSHIF